MNGFQAEGAVGVRWSQTWCLQELLSLEAEKMMRGRWPGQVHAGRGLLKIRGLDPKDSGEPLWNSEYGE